MEDTTGLRSRSRSKTPFLRSSCDREHCTEGADHLHHKTGRKTPDKRSTPIMQINQIGKAHPEPLVEVEESDASSPAYNTRNAMKSATEKLIKTSDYSSEESLDRIIANKRDVAQNEKNHNYESERVTISSTSVHASSGSLTNLSALSPIYNERSYHVLRPLNASRDNRSSRLSPAFSACSTDSSFAEQALADASVLLDDPQHPPDHLPYRLYRMAGEYWNKYPKTDFTYSPLSRDRVELAPGQVAVPNMSRRSLSQFRIQGPLVSPSEAEHIEAEMMRQKKNVWETGSTLRNRYNHIDSSEDEDTGKKYLYKEVDQRWWLTRIIMTIITTITETTSSVYHGIVVTPQRNPYRHQQEIKKGFLSQTASLIAAPFYWIYRIVTKTVTTITETVTPNHVGENSLYNSHARHRTTNLKKRRWWPWFLLLLLPLVGYGSYYTYENYDEMAMINFTDFKLDLTEFSAIDLNLPEINISLPDISESLPEVTKTYNEYKDIVQNRVSDASDYTKVVLESCYEEISRVWRNVIG